MTQHQKDFLLVVGWVAAYAMIIFLLVEATG